MPFIEEEEEEGEGEGEGEGENRKNEELSKKEEILNQRQNELEKGIKEFNEMKLREIERLKKWDEELAQKDRDIKLRQGIEQV